MPISTEQAKALRPRQVLLEPAVTNGKGEPKRWFVSGQPVTWKTRPLDVDVPVKHGLYEYGRLTQRGWKDEDGQWHLSYSDFEFVELEGE